MVEVATEHGYGGATVARVAECAGLTRKTFYAYFSDREECFAAAYASIVRRVCAEARAWGLRRSGESALAPLGALLEQVSADPAAARLALFEVNAAQEPLRAAHEETLRRLEGEIGRWLERGWLPQEAPQLPVTALRGGIEGVISIRVLRGEAGFLPDLRDDLIAWIESYRLTAGCAPLSQGYWDRQAARFLPRAPRIAPGPALLPRGRSPLPSQEAAAERRLRLLEATLRMTAQRGYSRATVAEIASAARVNKGAFYSHFASKQDAFLAAQRLRLEESLAATASAFYAESGWLDRVWKGLRALLRYLAENPDAAVSGMGEAAAAGEDAIRLEHDIRLAFTLFLEEGYRQPLARERPLPAIFSEAIAGASHALIRKQVLFADPACAPKLLPQLAYVTVAPFVGHDVAISFIERVAAELPASREAVASYS